MTAVVPIHSSNGDVTLEPLLTARDIVVEYRTANGDRVQAVSGVSLTVRRGETLGLVGESGSGKSTLSRAIMQLPPPQAGVVTFDGEDLTALDAHALRRTRARMQMIFQDPLSSLNPRRAVEDIVAEPLATWSVGSRDQRRAKAHTLMEAVGLDPAVVGRRRRRELSGGQCQRVSIARALSLDPKMLICDESVSALDVSVQAQILNLLAELKDQFALTMIFVSHDLGVVRRVSDRVAVMYLGKIVEVADSERLYRAPRHHYTRALLSSIPHLDPSVRTATSGLLKGEPPSPTDPPSGCRFRTRCPRAEAICQEAEPALVQVGRQHEVACHFPLVTDDDGARA